MSQQSGTDAREAARVGREMAVHKYGEPVSTAAQLALGCYVSGFEAGATWQRAQDEAPAETKRLTRVVGLLVQAANAPTAEQRFEANAQAQREWNAPAEDEPT